MRQRETDLLLKDYQRVELSMSAGQANLYALTFVVPILLIYIPAYILAWPDQFSLLQLKNTLYLYKTWIFIGPVILIAVFILGAIIHELLHGLTWALFCKEGVKSIEYGIYWSLLTPYCHCREILSKSAYILGGIMPGLIMGFFPALWGLIIGNLLVFLFGLFFSMAASGDLLVLSMLLRHKKGDYVQDHPEKIGCYVFVKNER
jgi:hypothetical protein